MALIVVGGHSRNIGKTSVVAGLVAALPEFHWTAMKITQYGHGICSANGKICDCASADHVWAVTEERNRNGDSDTSRFLVSGAVRSLWVRTRQGMLAEAMPRVRKELAGAENAILESNSIMGFLQPDLYLTVLDAATEDFKQSAQQFLDRANAVILHDEADQIAWKTVSLDPVAGKPTFRISPPQYVTLDLIDFVRAKLSAIAATS
jgi:hypothetical protein